MFVLWYELSMWSTACVGWFTVGHVAFCCSPIRELRLFVRSFVWRLIFPLLLLLVQLIEHYCLLLTLTENRSAEKFSLSSSASVSVCLPAVFFQLIATIVQVGVIVGRETMYLRTQAQAK